MTFQHALLAVVLTAALPGIADAQSTKYFARMKLSVGTTSAAAPAAPKKVLSCDFENLFESAEGPFTEIGTFATPELGKAACESKAGLPSGTCNYDGATGRTTYSTGSVFYWHSGEQVGWGSYGCRKI
jgi:hypothetical protein